MSSTNRGGIREIQDRYMTPTWCIDLIMDKIIPARDFSDCGEWKYFLEPCKGTGNIYNHPKLENYIKNYAELDLDIDYLDPEFDTDADLIITNPPFSKALEFLEKSLSCDWATVIYLMRLNFLGSQKRKEFWNLHRPSHLYVLSKRPSFTDNGNTDSTEYAWFCFQKSTLMIDPPGIYVL